MPASFITPAETYQAVLRAGVLTATFPAKSYPRRLNELIVECSVASGVDIYVAIVAPSAKIATNNYGVQNTLNPVNRPTIPPGQPLFVVWPGATTGIARATLTCEGQM
jgi:hypothetical protein